ncbi:uncharacterized protein KY384_002773 [Bacidia gigantensis]|uniref:uncharacterized protein n=1 Tax=Bacidia gigantensis TaxID=2732470 RepID=UPI001D04DE63|nr:uncharacterized protein KY384_002773 [Bacidia gigantensis]KAG8532895.1 hypothetical protein KY384_002773 [Bacidia gigantensis]
MYGISSVSLTPGITALEYAQRRSKLASELPNGAIAILEATDVKWKSHDVFYDFHQNSNFFYLTGKDATGKDHTFYLYVREKDAKAEQWEGVRSGTQAAVDIFNADETGDITSLSTHLKSILSSASKVYTDIPTTKKPDSSFLSRFISPSTASTPFASLLGTTKTSPLNPLLNNLRAIKSPAELSLLRTVGQRSGRALTSAIAQSWPSESSLHNHLSYQFRASGCDKDAYIPVVAGGRNASIIHYTSNNALLKCDDMVLVDAGGQYGGYVADITRTWPVSGKFTTAQKDLYNAVLAVQRHCVSLCRANAGTSLDDLHKIAESLLQQNLSDIGFERDYTGKIRNFIRLFPHHVGHYVGLDVHDTPGLSRKKRLEEGMCVTVEPGVYVPDEEEFPPQFRGMGVRVEDSVGVGEEGPVVFSTEAVKEVEDIEALRR